MVNITDPEHVCFGEHVVSILTNSYSTTGGLNGTMGGPQSAESNARGHATETTWKNGMSGLVKQNLSHINEEKIKGELRDGEFYEKYRVNGSEMVLLEEHNRLLKGEVEEYEIASENGAIGGVFT